MKQTLACLAIVIGSLLCGCSHTTGEWPSRALERITPEDVQRNIFYLASDTMRGRNTPSPELDTAAAYIAREFARDGLRPVNGSYYQHVLLNIVNLGEPNALRVRSGSVEKSYEIKTDFSPFEMTSNSSVRGPVVFAGYGITAPRYHYDDYAGIDVRGKIVIARYGGAWRGIKPKVAAEHGATGCIIYSDPRDDGYFEGDVYPRGAYRSEFGGQRGSVADMPLYPGDPLTPFVGATKNAKRLPLNEARTLTSIPVLPISYGDALPLLRALGGPVAPAEWRGALPITYHCGPGPATVHLKLEFSWDIVPIRDVIATLKGSGEPPTRPVLPGSRSLQRPSA